MLTIDAWIAKGLPHERTKSGGYEINSAAMMAWRCEQAMQGKTADNQLDLGRERARLARAQSEKTELELAERRGELVEVAEVRATVYELAKQARDALTLLPARLSPQLEGLDQHAIERKMVAEIADICEQLRRPALG